MYGGLNGTYGFKNVIMALEVMHFTFKMKCEIRFASTLEVLSVVEEY